MSKKVYVYLLTFFFIASAAMLTPVALPYFTLETGSVEAPHVEGIGSLKDYAEALGAQSKRNIDRLKTSLYFGKWFVLSFAIFVTSGVGLLGLLAFEVMLKLRRSTQNTN